MQTTPNASSYWPHNIPHRPPSINSQVSLWTVDTDTCLIKIFTFTWPNPDLYFITILTD